MKKLWAFITKPHSLAVLAVLGSALVFGWSEFIAPWLRGNITH